MTDNLGAYLLAWFPMVVVALLVGALRDRTFGRRLSPEGAHAAAVAVAGVLLGFYIAGIHLVLPFRDDRQALLVGGLWVAITAALDGLLRWLAPAREIQPTVADDLFAGPARSRLPIGVVLLLWIGAAPWLLERFLPR